MGKERERKRGWIRGRKEKNGRIPLNIYQRPKSLSLSLAISSKSTLFVHSTAHTKNGTEKIYRKYKNRTGKNI